MSGVLVDIQLQHHVKLDLLPIWTQFDGSAKRLALSASHVVVAKLDFLFGIDTLCSMICMFGRLVFVAFERHRCYMIVRAPPVVSEETANLFMVVFAKALPIDWGHKSVSFVCRVYLVLKQAVLVNQTLALFQGKFDPKEIIRLVEMQSGQANIIVSVFA